MRCRTARNLWLAALAAVALASPIQAAEWRLLGDAGITSALSARVLRYEDGATQTFFTDGRTQYEVSTGTSWGKWWVEGGLYCSAWPPSEVPGCYSVDARALEIRFRRGAKDVTIGRYADL